MKQLEMLYLQHKDALFAFAVSLTRDKGEAEDAIQETFFKLGRSWRKYTGINAAYLFRAVRNHIIDRFRKKQSIIKHQDFLFQYYERDENDNNLEKKEDYAELMKILEALPAEYHEILILKVFSGFTFQQISKICSEPVSTLSSRYQKALSLMKLEMENYYE